ncbi:hypothetical protein ACFSX9_13155 [Flavobacterium ardleyense]|uniref:Uncharacterized protein n=1 Tax=Flavobacterium ardleyense TaxID=2038737 RepID=A0ABW5Z9Y7_9FLAO
MDLIRRIILSPENEMINDRFKEWLRKSGQTSLFEIQHKNRVFFISIINSSKFNDLILEDSTEWFYLHSEDNHFQCLCKIINYSGNLIDEKRYPNISASIWILKSDLINLKIHNPTLIYSPNSFENSLEKIDKDFSELLKKLDNEKVKLSELTGKNKINETKIKRIR